MAETTPRAGTRPETDPATIYTIDFASELPRFGGGVQAFRVLDRRAGGVGLMAFAVQPDQPMRESSIALLQSQPVHGIVSPLASIVARRPDGGQGWFVICPRPIGQPLWTPPYAPIAPWPESELMALVLRPAALALDQLQARHLTHRAIRPDNMFRATSTPQGREPVVLGAAWAAPPASLQPAIFEPPYVACCQPGGRGDGSIADDVYALGVCLLALTLGRLPMAGLTSAEIVHRKLELGSFAALAGDERLPSAIADLVRGMLAEDPEHRPAPALLADPVAARARRVAARPPPRAQRALEIGARLVSTARTAALALAEDPDQAIRLLRSGEVERWARRSLGDAALASRLDELARSAIDPASTDASTSRNQPADAMLLMCAVALLDPLAPLSWRGTMLWPDGIGPALAIADPQASASSGDKLEQMLSAEAIAIWATLRPGRCDPTRLRAEAQRWRHALQQRGWSGGLRRLYYELNPSIPCRSALLSGHFVTRLADLLPALDAIAQTDQVRDAVLIDREMAAFIAARQERRTDPILTTLAEARSADIVALTQLRLLASLQTKHHCPPAPALGALLARHVAPALKVWRNRARGARMQAALTALGPAGQLTPMLALLEDPAALATDAAESGSARIRLARIEARIAAVAGGAARRRQSARRIAHEIATCLSAAALTVALVAAWLG